MNWDYEVDVAIVGGGACGLTAALAAGIGDGTDPGRLQVAVFERNSEQLSNADISSGTLAAGGTRFQRELGIDDTPEAHAADVMRLNRGEADPEIVRALCEAAPRYVEWMADRLGVPMKLHVDSRRHGHSTPRLHSDPDRLGGKIMMSALRSVIRDTPNVHFVDHTPGIGLLLEGDRVVGVQVLENGTERSVRADHVVLACDGFGANQEMLAEYIPELVGAPYVGVEGNRGDAIRWAQGLGVELAHMQAYQGHGFIVEGYLTRLNPQIVLEGGIVVNESGARFVAEDIGYSELAPHLLELPGNRAVELWDQAIMDRLPESEAMRESEEAKAYRFCETLEEVATAFELPSDALKRTVELYNRGVETGRDELGRTTLLDPLVPPFYAARITGGLAHTQGGIRVDVHGRALRPNGAVVEGLFAGGGSAVGISGSSPFGYLSGNGLLSAVGSGYIIGNYLHDRESRT